jgi:hypothetical protein
MATRKEEGVVVARLYRARCHAAQEVRTVRFEKRLAHGVCPFHTVERDLAPG